MSYRDERDALKERAASLEEELRAATQQATRSSALEVELVAELERTARENKRLRARLAKVEDPDRGPRLARVLGGILLFVVLLGLAMCGALRVFGEPDDKPRPPPDAPSSP